MGAVRVINDDGHFLGEMSSAGTKLVVVDFTATWYDFFRLSHIPQSISHIPAVFSHFSL